MESLICWNFSEIELKWRIPETHSAGDMVRRLIIAKSEADFTSHAGLGLIGMAISQHTDLAKDATAAATLSRPLAHCYAANLDSNPFGSRLSE